MGKTSSIYARVEPKVKQQAEQVLEQLGVPMSTAVGLFLHQIVLQQGLPFDVKLPQNMPLDIGSLSVEDFNSEIQIGIIELANGKVTPADRVAEKMRHVYDLRDGK